MSFSSTLIKRETFSGKIMELWSWNAAAVTTGTITPDTSDDDGIGLIKSIDMCPTTATSTDAAVVTTYTSNVSRPTVTVTCTANSVGVITLVGNAQ
ncbi:MAG: hypothetical protein KBE16_07885 [Alphaproteobacteria bacterium]|nr:hypothetical protein [Alphaproteobacteria bacterium]